MMGERVRDFKPSKTTKLALSLPNNVKPNSSHRYFTIFYFLFTYNLFIFIFFAYNYVLFIFILNFVSYIGMLAVEFYKKMLERLRSDK